MTAERTRLSLRLDRELAKTIESVAAAADVSVNDLLSQLLRESFAKRCETCGQPLPVKRAKGSKAARRAKGRRKADDDPATSF